MEGLSEHIRYNANMGSLKVNLYYCLGLFMGAACIGIACGDIIKAAGIGAIFSGAGFVVATAADMLTKRRQP